MTKSSYSTVDPRSPSTSFAFSSLVALPVTFFGSFFIGYVLGKNDNTSRYLDENYNWLMNQVFAYLNPLLNSFFFLDLKSKASCRSEEVENRVMEICIDNIESCLMAAEGGANSVELCSDRTNGGITPSYGFISECVSRLKSSEVKVHVLIRPRMGDFTYSATEFDVILRDILAAQALGAQGVVVGVVTSEGKVDTERLRVIRTLSRGMILTFHRAFDSCCGSIEATTESLEAVIECGCDRILTSQKSTAYEGREELSNLVKLARGRISLVAAAGITPDNVYDIITSSKVQGVHAGGSLHSKVAPPSNVNTSTWIPVGTGQVASTSTSTSTSTPTDAFSWDRVDESSVKMYVANATRGFQETAEDIAKSLTREASVVQGEQVTMGRGGDHTDGEVIVQDTNEIVMDTSVDNGIHVDAEVAAVHDDDDDEERGEEEDDPLSVSTLETSSGYVHIDWKKSLTGSA